MPASVKFDPRKLMEKAVEVMQQSIAEPRADGKASPRVGAVLWKPDGTVETACRGELRQGDHAEYTLLERKSRDARLEFPPPESRQWGAGRAGVVSGVRMRTHVIGHVSS
jgi:hypothetical protein